MGLVGESGCGKTTTILAMMGLLPATASVSGKVLLEGEDILARGEDSVSPHRWKDIAMVFQGAMNAFNPVRTVGDQIAEPMVSMAAPADGSRPSSARRASTCTCGSCRALPMCSARRSSRRWWRSICRSVCPTGSAPAAAGREQRPAAARRPPVFRVLGAVARRDLCSGLWRGLPDRAGHIRAAAQGVEATLQHRRRKSARSMRPLRVDEDAAGPRVRGPSRAGILAAQRRQPAERTEEGQEPPLRARSRGAPGFADRGRVPTRSVKLCRPKVRRPMTCWMHWPAPPSRGGLSPVSPCPIPRTRRRAMRLDWQWPFGHEVC